MSDNVGPGTKVSVSYVGTLSDGTVFDTSEGKGDFSFEIGAGQVIPGFENNIIGMSAGEQKKFDIPVDQAYGERNLEAVQVIPREAFPDDMEIVVGSQVEGEGPDGNKFPAIIIAEASNGITIDMNHPLAGEDLTFDVTVLSVE